MKRVIAGAFGPHLPLSAAAYDPNAERPPDATERAGASTPSAIARVALRQLAALRMAPTPDNFARIYYDIALPGNRPRPGEAFRVLREIATELGAAAADRATAGAALNRALDVADWSQVKEVVVRQCLADPATVSSWAALIRELIQSWDAPIAGITQAHKRDALELALAASAASPELLHTRLRGVLQSWADSAGAGAPGKRPTTFARAVLAVHTATGAMPDRGAAANAVWAQTTAACRKLLAEALATQVTQGLGYTPALVREAQKLANDVQAAIDPAHLEALAVKLRAFWQAAGRVGEEQRAIGQGLLRLLELLTANVSELVGDGSWMRNQVKALAALAKGKITLKAIAELESALREIAQRQGALKHSLDQAKDAMKHMIATFVERLGELEANAGGYHERLTTYCTQIEGASDIAQLSSVIVRIMDDTRSVQVDLGRSREELGAARRAVEQFQERTSRLESELVLLSDRLQEDQLTRVLNRRGLSRAFATESVRADRHHRPVSLAMLDVDNFKLINDRLGHQAGDSALVHITEIIRASLRASDLIARYGGEEFVILLPETALDGAMRVLERVQRDLAKNPFQHDEEKVVITFSAGVAERVSGESEDALIARADKALYAAKKDGKNRLVTH